MKKTKNFKKDNAILHGKFSKLKT